MALPTFQDMLAATNPTGTGFGGSTSGLTQSSSGTGYNGLTYSGGAAAPIGSSPQFGSPPQYTYADGSAAASAQAAQDAANTAAYYQDQINNLNGQNGRLDAQQNVGLGNLQNSYNSSLNRLDTQKGQAQQNYDLQNQTNTDQYGRNRSAIQTQTANHANALQRLLGIAGSGNSSAAYEAAPYAAGLQGTQQIGDAQNAYATNARNLDMNWQNTLGNYNLNKQDLGQKLFAGQSGLKQSIAQTRADLLSQISQLGTQRDMANGANYTTARNNQSGYQTQINSLLNAIVGLGNQYANPVISTGDVAFNTPSLSQYNLKSGNTAQIQNQNPGTSDINPVFAPLLNQQRDQFGNLIAA